MCKSISVEETTWEFSKLPLETIRRQVFMKEQFCPEEEEFDGLDAQAIHFLAKDKDGNVVGCCRIVNGNKLERMAVVENYRGKGVGKLLMESSLNSMRNKKETSVKIHAQTHALQFYQSFGFVSYGDIFMEAGIPHSKMELNLD
jgi:predicted GNAT family N-acyltransferase